MSESLLRWVLDLLDQIEEPVILHSEAAAFPPAQLEDLLRSGILRETLRAETIPRPIRFGHGSDLVVRETDRGLYGTADEGEYFDPISLTEEDVRQYEVVLPRLVEEFRRQNQVVGRGFRNDSGLVLVGQKEVEGIGCIDVYLSLPNDNPEVVLGRFARLENQRGTRVLVLTPGQLPLRPENRRILADGWISLASLSISAARGELVLDWNSALRVPPERLSARGATAVSKRAIPRSVGSPEAVNAVHDYLEATGLTLTDFGIQFGTTDRTVRRFLSHGKLRRSNFEAMAKSMGLTTDQLLRGDLPVSNWRKSFR